MSKHWLCLMVIAGTSIGLFAQEDPPVEEPNEADPNALYEAIHKPDGVGPEYDDYLRKKAEGRQRLKEFRKSVEAEKDAKVQALKDERAAKIDPRESTTVTVDEDTINVDEPKTVEEAIKIDHEVRDLYTPTDEDFDMLSHERWELNLSDFQFDRPRYVVYTQAALKTRRAFMFTFSVTNSTTKRRRIAPLFVAITDKGVYMPEVSGYLPLRMAADSTMHPLASSNSLRDRKWLSDNVIPMESVHHMGAHIPEQDGVGYKLNPEETFEAGQTRWGAAIWPDFNDEWTEMKIVVFGLSNNHRYEERQRRAMVMHFSRNDDEFHVERSLLKFHNKEWVWLWMWDQDIRVPIPAEATDPQIKETLLETPTGNNRLVWSFPYEINNSTRSDETIEITESRFVLSMDVNIGGEKVPVAVEVVDDGRSSIYKAQYIREQGWNGQIQEKNRFVPDAEKTREKHHRTHTVASGTKVEGLYAVFDSKDVDWQNTYYQVENYLSMKIDRSKLAKQRWKKLVDKYAKENKKLNKVDAMVGYDPRRRLTDDLLVLKDGRKFKGEVIVETEELSIIDTLDGARLEFLKPGIEKIEYGEKAEVRKQIAAKLPEALGKAKAKKEVVAFFKAHAGLASGKYRIKRSYRQRGVIQDEWLSAWEELDKPAE